MLPRISPSSSRLRAKGLASPFDAVDTKFISETVAALADVDGDGDLDLVWTTLSGALWYYENVGDASHMALESLGYDGHGLSPGNVGELAIAPRAVLGDLDGDGALELVVGDSAGYLSYFANSYCAPLASEGACSLRGLCRTRDGGEKRIGGGAPRRRQSPVEGTTAPTCRRRASASSATRATSAKNVRTATSASTATSARRSASYLVLRFSTSGAISL